MLDHIKEKADYVMSYKEVNTGRNYTKLGNYSVDKSNALIELKMIILLLYFRSYPYVAAFGS